MVTISTSLHLPAYDAFTNSIAALSLPISSSELHGVMCGYLCAGAINKGEAYLRALATKKKNNAAVRKALLALFEVYTVSQQQIINFDFEFQLLLPSSDASLSEQAQAFSEWCEGFAQGITTSGISVNDLEEEETQEALQHLTEFALLDYQSLHVDEEDERALMEVSEYVRMAVLHIYSDLQASSSSKGQSEIAH